MSDVTRILSAIEEGDAHAAEQLLPLVYDEFRKFGGTVLVQRFLRGRLLRQRGGLSGRIQLLSPSRRCLVAVPPMPSQTNRWSCPWSDR